MKQNDVSKARSQRKGRGRPALSDRSKLRRTSTSGTYGVLEEESFGATVVFRTGLSFFGTVFGAALTLATAILIARVVGPELYGRFELGRGFLDLLRSISLVGLNTMLVRYVAIFRAAQSVPRIFGAIWGSVGVSSVICLVLVLVCWPLSGYAASVFFNDPGLALVFRLFLLTLPFYSLLPLFTAASQALNRVDHSIIVVKLIFPSLALTLTAVVSFSFDTPSIGYCVAAFGLTSIITSFIAFHLARKTLKKLFGAPQKFKFDLRNLLFASATSWLSVVANAFMLQIGRFLVGRYSTIEDVGIYVAAQSIALTLNLFLVSVTPVLVPQIAKLYAEKKSDELTRIFSTTTRWTVLAALPVAMVLIIGRGTVMSAFGEQFAEGGSLLVILVLGQLCGAGTGPTMRLLDMAGRQAVHLRVGVAVLLSYSVLGMWVIPVFGVLGAAVLSALASAGLFLSLAVLATRVLKLRLYKWSLIRPWLAGLLAVACGISVGRMIPYWIAGTNIVQLIICLILYVPLAWCIGTTPGDKRLAGTVTSSLWSRVWQ